MTNFVTTCQRDPVGCPFPTGKRKLRKHRTQLWICLNCGQGWRYGSGSSSVVGKPWATIPNGRDKWLRWPAPNPAQPTPLSYSNICDLIKGEIKGHEFTYKHKKKELS